MNTRPHILIVQFRKSATVVSREQEVYQSAANGAVELSFLNACIDIDRFKHSEEVLRGIDGVILGGSGELFFDGGFHADHPGRVETRRVAEEITPFLNYIFESQIPVLGICFGHQLIGHVRGAPVVHKKDQAKTGSYTVAISEAGRQTPLLADVPTEFIAQYGHKDSVASLPKGAVVVVSSSTCDHAALWYGGHQYTVQFHPELTEGDMRERMVQSPEYLPPGKTADDLLQPSPHSEQILKNFFAIVQRCSVHTTAPN